MKFLPSYFAVKRRMAWLRRAMIFRAAIIAAVALCLTPVSSLAAENPVSEERGGDNIVVTLLGTSAPALSTVRFGPSTLVQAGGLNLLFDAGRGSATRLMQLGVSLGTIEGVFITHFHSDHLNGFSDVWMTGYLGPHGGRSTPLNVYGPNGIKQIMDGLMSAFQADRDIRGSGGLVVNEGTLVETHEYSSDGVVFDQGGVRVTAFEVNHGELIKPSYGYRVDYSGRSVVISGDTKYNQNVIDYGRGADLLIHEVDATNDPSHQAIMNNHTSPEDAGRIFTEAAPKMAAYTHILRLGSSDYPPPSLDELAARTRETYDGPLTIGEDLLRFVIGDQVSVIPLYTEY
jgi:ribonuclease Z